MSILVLIYYLFLNFGFSGCAMCEASLGEALGKIENQKLFIIDAEANAGVDLTMEKNLDLFIKNDTHNTKNDLVIHNYLHIKCYLVIKLYSYFLGVSIDFRENSSKAAKYRSFFASAYEIRYNHRTNYSRWTP